LIGRVTGYVSRNSSRFRGWSFSLLFGLVVIGCFYLLQWIIPAEVAYYNEIVTILFIILSVLILFPAREEILKLIMKKTDYFSFFGRDFHHIDFIARQFTMDALVHEIFPELLVWLRVPSGRLVILDEDRRNYLLYVCRGPLVRETRLPAVYPLDDLKKRFLHNRASMNREDADISERELLEKFEALIIQPFMFRKRLLGFLIINSMPKNKFYQRALDLFAGKAAVSIQNHILSSMIVENRLYDQEFVAAEKIRNLLQSSRVPSFERLQVKNLKKNRSPCLIEFFRNNDRQYLVIVSTPRLTGAAGIVLYGLLGYLYSYIQTEKNIQMNRLPAFLRRDQDLAKAGFRLDILVAEIQYQENMLVLLIDGLDYTVWNVQTEQKYLVSPGWRNFIEIKAGSPVRIDYRREGLVEFSALPAAETVKSV